ncbi:hypothetical protein C1646_662686 [Rhizophagus diaphanus]|nr:hypothetical protein C1646_662686 [Rhizophagus diaphanus] [Rhizophagus sp. MUCL 43196]
MLNDSGKYYPRNDHDFHEWNAPAVRIKGQSQIYRVHRNTLETIQRMTPRTRLRRTWVMFWRNMEWMIMHCLAEILVRLKNYGTLQPDSFEVMYNEYVVAILHTAINIVTENNFRMRPECKIIGNENSGRVDYAVKIYRGSKLPFTIEFTDDALEKESKDRQDRACLDDEPDIKKVGIEAIFKRYKELKPEHGKDGFQVLVKSEAREAIPEAKCSDEALRKRMESSEKGYKLFNSINKEKIARINSTPPGFILNLTKDEKDYVMAEILKQRVLI